jgi:hypothetical protein
VDPTGLSWSSFTKGFLSWAVPALAVVLVAGLVVASLPAVIATSVVATVAAGFVLGWGVYLAGEAFYEMVSRQEAWTGRPLNQDEVDERLGELLAAVFLAWAAPRAFRGSRSGTGACKSYFRPRGAPKRGGPYGHLEDHPSVNSGKDFTQSQKAKILAENEANNGGILRDDRTGEVLVRPRQSQKGVTPPSNEANVDHAYPKSEGGPNSFSNADVRSRANNLKKSNKLPGDE